MFAAAEVSLYLTAAYCTPVPSDQVHIFGMELFLISILPSKVQLISSLTACQLRPPFSQYKKPSTSAS